MAIKGLTPEEILALDAAVDIPTAGKCFKMGRSKAYELARSGKFPVPVLPLGATFCVTRANDSKRRRVGRLGVLPIASRRAAARSS
jgi:hypothetical protein